MTPPVGSVAYVIVAFRNSMVELASLCTVLLEAGRLAGLQSSINLVVNDDSQFPEMNDVHVIQGQGNVGFAAGIALGVRKAPEEYIVMVNPDCEPDFHEFGKFLSYIRADGSILIPRLCKENGEFDYMPYENWTFTIGRSISEKLCKYRLLANDGNDLPRFAKLSGAFIGMERATAIRLDAPFDSDFFLYAEDRDMTDRVRAAKIPIKFLKDVVITHIGGGSGTTVSDLVEKCKSDGSLRVAYRRYGRLGALAFAIDQYVIDFIKARIGRSTARTAHQWSVDRWRQAGFSDPGPLNASILSG